MIKKLKSKNSVKILTAKDYAQTLSKIKAHVQEAQLQAVLAANKELIRLYWFIGQIISERQQEDGWGGGVIEKLARDLQNEFPGISGFSERNMFRIQSFYLAYQKVPQAVAELEKLPIFNIPWGHNAVILERIKDTEKRLWYAQQSIDNGWSRSALETCIKSDLYRRAGKAISNFKMTLPDPLSAMAQQTFKDPYVFDFLTLHNEYVEKDLEQGLAENVEKLLLEMGKGFALAGKQHHLEVGGKDYYIDLLFYHFKLKCFVVVELKAREFDPRDVGQINFYLSAVDDLIKSHEDKPTIGLLLCKTKNNFTAEYALRNLASPIGVAEYKTEIIKKLPKDLKRSLPTIEEIEAEFEKNEVFAKAMRKKTKPMKRIRTKN